MCMASMNESAGLLHCPRNGSKLRFQGSGFFSQDGDSVYPVEDGIIDLRCNRRDYYFNPVPRSAMTVLTEDARHLPWPQTIRRFMGHVNCNPDWLDNLVADGRYAWKLLLDLDPKAQVLDLGCGLGNLTKNLAPHVGRVFAMDLTIERLRFARERFAHFNSNDDIVLLAGGDGKYLPFPDKSLDLVVLSGVLEWLGDDEEYGESPDGKVTKAIKMALSIFGERNPRAIQQRFLQEIRRVLKPTGQLFIAIENRLNREYFHRRVDHHSGLRFASLLPRFVANLYSIIAARRPYRTYTYSMAGYRSLLKGAGFDRQQFFGLSPGYSHLSEIRPLVTEERFWSPPKHDGLRQRIANNKNLVPAFGIIATSSAVPPRSLLGRLISEIEAALKPDQPLTVQSFRVTEKDQGVLEVNAGGRPYVVKLPFNGVAVASVNREREALDHLKKHSGIGHLVPATVLHGSLQGVDYLVESRLPGRRLAEEGRRVGREAYLEQVVGFLEAMNPRSGGVTKVQLVGDLFRREVHEPLKRIAEMLDSPELIAPLAHLLRRGLLAAEFAGGVVHGDLNWSNILVAEGRISGLIGWHLFRPSGLPILDFLNYLDSVQKQFSPDSSEIEHIELLANGVWPSPKEWTFLRHQYNSLGIDFARHRELVYLSWVHRVAKQLDSHMIYDPKGIDQCVVTVLKRFNFSML
jgi:SAM-dependent methyltransferase